MTANSNASMQEQLGLSILNIERPHYKKLNLRNIKNNQWILSHVVEGNLKMTTGGEEYQVNPGQVMIHPPHVEFNELNPSSGIHQVLFLDVTLSDHLDLFRIYPLSPVITLSDEPRFNECFHQLMHVWNQPEHSFRSIHIFSGIIELIKLLLLSWEATGQKTRPNVLNSAEDRFMEVIRYMKVHMNRKISRDELSSLVHLHPNYFDKLFHHHFGQTPMQMLRSLRLRKAATLLETTACTLETIAAECGLGDAAYFTRLFKNEYMETPGQYRNRMQKLKKIYGNNPA